LGLPGRFLGFGLIRKLGWEQGFNQELEGVGWPGTGLFKLLGRLRLKKALGYKTFWRVNIPAYLNFSKWLKEQTSHCRVWTFCKNI